jgi:hypothetical protein
MCIGQNLLVFMANSVFGYNKKKNHHHESLLVRVLILSKRIPLLANTYVFSSSCVIIGALAMFGLRYYRTKIQYRPVADEGIEVL